MLTKYTKKGKYTKKRKNNRKSSVSLSVATVKSIVKKQVDKNIEDLNVQYASYYTFGNYINNNLLNYKILTPSTYSVAQGTGAADRRGNRVTIKKVMFRYLINPLPYNATTNPTPQPQEVQLLFANLKGNQRTVPTSGSMSIMYQTGNTSSPPTGSCTDLIKPFNYDAWNIKRRIIHKVGCATYGGTGISVINQSFANNDFSYNIRRTIDITKLFPKVWYFDDTNNTATSNALYFMVQAVNADNTIASSTTLSQAIEFWLDVTYEDA